MAMSQAEVAVLCKPTVPKLTQADIDKQRAEFLAKGGEIVVLSNASSAHDFASPNPKAYEL